MEIWGKMSKVGLLHSWECEAGYGPANLHPLKLALRECAFSLGHFTKYGTFNYVKWPGSHLTIH